MEIPDRYPALLDHAQDLILVLTPAGEIQYANAAIERILGYDPETLVGEDAFEFIHPEDHEQTRDTFDRLVASDGAAGEVEHRTMAADGSWVWLQSRMEGVTAAELDGYVVSSRDVTDWKRAERERETSQERLQEIAQQANDVLWMFTADWDELLFATPAYEEVFGGSLAALRENPLSFLDHIHPEDRGRVMAAMSRLSEGEPVEIDYRVNPDVGFRRWVTVEGVPIVEDGTVNRVAGYARDVTDRRRRERQLLVMDRLLRHNLNNDMNVILGYAELVREIAGEPVAEHVDTILRTGESLLKTARKERDLVDALVTPIAQDGADLRSLLDDALASLRETYPDVTVEVSMADDLAVSTAPVIRLALDELLENAAEHADTDTPTVEVHVDHTETGVELAVVDNCPPIPRNEYEPLFDEQVHDYYHGTGLGLTLACWVVDLVDGDIAFERRAGGGNRVVVTLPVCEA